MDFADETRPPQATPPSAPNFRLPIRTVYFIDGPWKGRRSIVSHATAWFMRECYVQGGDPARPNDFIHAKTLLQKLPEKQFQHERARIASLLEDGGKVAGSVEELTVALLNLPAFRVNAWYQLLKVGQI